jgi:hypothetical protein
MPPRNADSSEVALIVLFEHQRAGVVDRAVREKIVLAGITANGLRSECECAELLISATLTLLVENPFVIVRPRDLTSRRRDGEMVYRVCRALTALRKQPRPGPLIGL